MVREQKVIRSEEKVGLFGGAGSITMDHLLEGPDEMYGKGRLFAHITINPGSEVGYHEHHGESETYYIVRGKGRFNDNGTERIVVPGDVTFTGDGQGHAMTSIGEEPLEMVAMILYK